MFGRKTKVTQAGNGLSRRPVQGLKSKSFSNMQYDTIVKISSISQSQKISEEIQKRFTFSPNWRRQNLFCSTENLKKQEIEKNDFFSKNVSGESHSAENREESSILAKPLVSSKNRWGALLKTN